ncbi:DUF397 domain-containing protein [Streptomyces inhibens]|uniref:DUF397 domain-containing protein n=1 Tax=Streptomyces inhibens TaxID=2293571 RepID=UPI00378F7A20
MVRPLSSDANGGQCIEFSRALTQAHGLVPVRDSKAPGRPRARLPGGRLDVVRLGRQAGAVLRLRASMSRHWVRPWVVPESGPPRGV